MNQSVAALVGISGVGKTTFLRRLAQEVQFQHLTAGTLISAAKANGRADRDRLRLSNIDENQKPLVAGFHFARDLRAPLVILDGHLVIGTFDGLQTIGACVFSELEISGMIHLAASPAQIATNRSRDADRDRPQLSDVDLERHQRLSIAASVSTCRILGIPLLDASADDIDAVKRFLRNLSKAEA